VFANVSAGADTKANTPGCGALELLDLRLLEDSRELGDALVSDVVGAETVQERQSGEVSEQACQRALTQKRALWSRFEYRAAYSSDCRVELPLRPSASAEAPSSPMRLRASL